MDSDGLLYGSVSMRLTSFQTRPRFEVSRNLVTLSDTNYKATISLCLLLFPVGFPPSTLPYFRYKHKRVSCGILSKYSNILSHRQRGDLDWNFGNSSVSHSRIPSPTSFSPKTFLEHLPHAIGLSFVLFTKLQSPDSSNWYVMRKTFILEGSHKRIKSLITHFNQHFVKCLLYLST